MFSTLLQEARDSPAGKAAASGTRPTRRRPSNISRPFAAIPARRTQAEHAEAGARAPGRWPQDLGTCKCGIGAVTNRRRHERASHLAQRADRAVRALSVAMPV